MRRVKGKKCVDKKTSVMRTRGRCIFFCLGREKPVKGRTKGGGGKKKTRAEGWKKAAGTDTMVLLGKR